MSNHIEGNTAQYPVWESTTPINDENAFRHSNTHESPFRAFLAAGIPHMSLDVYAVNYSGSIRNVFVKEVGKYGGDGDQNIFKGVISGTPDLSSGHAFGYTIRLVNVKDGSDVIQIASDPSRSVYYYPNDFYGRPYPLASDDTD